MANVSENTQYYDIFPTRLRELMEQRGTKQEELASACGVKRQTIAQWKDGKTKPDNDMIAAIARFYQVSADYLLGLSPNATMDMELDAICRYTGLSIKAIQNMKESCEFFQQPNSFDLSEALNFFISSNQFMSFLGCLMFYMSAVDRLKEAETVFSTCLSTLGQKKPDDFLMAASKSKNVFPVEATDVLHYYERANYELFNLQNVLKNIADEYMKQEDTNG